MQVELKLNTIKWGKRGTFCTDTSFNPPKKQ